MTSLLEVKSSQSSVTKKSFLSTKSVKLNHKHSKNIYFEDKDTVKCGELFRYKVKIFKSGISKDESFHIQFKNEESIILLPVYLTGPYTFYVDVRPFNYDENEPFSENIYFAPNVKPDEKFKAVLTCNDNSFNEKEDCFEWTIDVISQLAVLTSASLDFKLELYDHKIKPVRADVVKVDKLSTYDIWSMPPKNPDLPVHLVIITHGIFSNIGCDMLCLKDKIEKVASTQPVSSDNIVVRGCMDNIGKSGKGLEYLGTAVAEYILKVVEESKYTIDKISFLGHSLGGPVQAFAIYYIYHHEPHFFDKIEPINFVTLASPMLGVAAELPMYTTIALDFGGLGKTGRDLNFKHRYLIPKDNQSNKPILEIVPQCPIFKKFKNRTVYANVLHDGIVPLRTSALLYLDWYGVDKVFAIFKSEGLAGIRTYKEDRKQSTTGEIPLLTLGNKMKLKKYRRLQILGNEENSGSNNEDDDVKGNLQQISGDVSGSIPDFKPIPKASTFMAAANVLLSALPTENYIKNPDIRTDGILHDRIYYPEELPPAHYTNREIFKKIIYPRDKIYRKEERIARYWQESMQWRKVLVVLKPDSHNNIIVRRRFINLFGNVVIDHAAKTHFAYV
ncbi:related to Putative lipase YDR444W [Saccharomycodes ludwigii]|uniref:Related to Putative lipase YDR444W n=1 Tax=Saccharomycodes ludwigii TaxID=36035 RepID=A0A376B3S5_9ASCO|nr:related to Putative lipase YDR444W [Saccharomycodes ludwigii]